MQLGSSLSFLNKHLTFCKLNWLESRKSQIWFGGLKSWLHLIWKLWNCKKFQFVFFMLEFGILVDHG